MEKQQQKSNKKIGSRLFLGALSLTTLGAGVHQGAAAHVYHEKAAEARASANEAHAAGDIESFVFYDNQADSREDQRDKHVIAGITSLVTAGLAGLAIPGRDKSPEQQPQSAPPIDTPPAVPPVPLKKKA